MDTRVYVGRSKQDFWPLNMVSSASREAQSVLTSLPRLLITLPTHNTVALRYSCPCSLLRSCDRTCRYFLVKRKDEPCDRTLPTDSMHGDRRGSCLRSLLSLVFSSSSSIRPSILVAWRLKERRLFYFDRKIPNGRTSKVL
jgi:hypothetical protein